MRQCIWLVLMVAFLVCTGCAQKNPLADKANDLVSAAEGGNRETVVSIISENPNLVNLKDSHGITALHAATQKGDLEMVQLLLSKDADVNITDTQGWTALHFATQISGEKGTKIAGLLIKKGAGVNARNKDGVTPLAMAKEGKFNEETEILLIKNGAKE